MTSGTSAREEGAERPSRGNDPRLKTTRTLVAIPGVAAGGTPSLLNLSTAGACVEIDERVEPGQVLELKLAHPKLQVVPLLPAEVAWCTETDGGRMQLGVRFQQPTEAGVAVRPFLTAEAGSCLFQDRQLVGFVVPHGQAQKAWSLFDADGKRLAVAALDPAGYQVHAKTGRAGALPSFHAASLAEATRKALGVEEPLRLEPPIATWQASSAPPAAAELPADEAQPAGRDARGRPVSGPDGPLGFLCEAEMPDSWLVVDQGGKQVAFLAASGPDEIQICSMGDAIDDELEFQSFADLQRAVAAAFQLDDAHGLQIGESITVGTVAPVRIEDSESSVDLEPAAAVQVTLAGFPSLQGPMRRRPPAAAPPPTTTRPARAQTGKTARGVSLSKQEHAGRMGRVVAAVLTVVALSFVGRALWNLILTYTS